MKEHFKKLEIMETKQKKLVIAFEKLKKSYPFIDYDFVTICDEIAGIEIKNTPVLNIFFFKDLNKICGNKFIYCVYTHGLHEKPTIGLW